MRGRLDEDLSGYPAPLLTVVWVSVKRTALEFIDETCPQAWYRPMFADAADSPAGG